MDDFEQDNARELQRLRDLAERLSDDDLRRPVNERWTVAAVLGHVAFWDARAIYLAERFDPSSGFPDPVHIMPGRRLWECGRPTRRDQ